MEYGRIWPPGQYGGQGKAWFWIFRQNFVSKRQGRLGVPDLWGGPMSISTPPRRRMFRPSTRCCARQHEIATDPHHGRGWHGGGHGMNAGHAPSPMPGEGGEGGGGAKGNPLTPNSQPASHPASHSISILCGCLSGRISGAGQSRTKQTNPSYLVRTLCVRTRTNAPDMVCPALGRVRGWPEN